MKDSVKIIRLTQLDKGTLALLYEYYDAVNVVVRDSPETLQKFVADPSCGFWVAAMDQRLVGCVALRTLDNLDQVGECKRLYVRPEARGKGIADLLLDELEVFAKSKNMTWIYLDTYDDLKAAINLYIKRGYESCDRYNDNPQATVFLRKQIKM